MGFGTFSAILVLASLHLLFCTGLFLRVVSLYIGNIGRNSAFEHRFTVDGMSHWQPDNPCRASAGIRLECGKLWRRLHDRRRPSVSHLREHDIEGQAYRNPGWHGDQPRGDSHGWCNHRTRDHTATIELGVKRDAPAHGRLLGEPRGADQHWRKPAESAHAYR